MGMLACYMEVTPAQLEELKAAAARGEAFDVLEDLESTGAGGELCELDKLWDGVHCLLTGQSLETLTGDSPLTTAVFGQESLSTEPGQVIACNPPETVAQVRQALDAFDLETALANFDPARFHALDIYPAIWAQEDAEDLREELRYYCEELRGFYRRMDEKGCAVIASVY